MRTTANRVVSVLGAVLAMAVVAVLPADAAFRGDQGRIAFSRDGDLYSMLPDGTDLRAITVTSHDDRWPRWSPDGAHLAFVRDGDVYLLRWVNGTPDPLVQLTATGDVVGAPSWHPDGTRLAYARSNQGIWSVTVEESTTSELIAAPSVTPAWSPRGDSIAFSDGAHLYRSNLASAPVRLTIDPNGRFDQPSWCPDGERIVYRATDSATGNTGIQYVFPFRPAAGGGFIGGGLFYETDVEPACRPDATPDVFSNTLPEVVITRRNRAGGTDIAVGPLPHSANGVDGWFRTLTAGNATRNAEADWQPKLAWDVRVLETNSETTAVVRVTVPVSLPRPLALDWSLSPLFATAPDDYRHAAGNVTVGAGETEVLIPVVIVGDVVPERDEAFEVIVTFPGFVSIARVTIVDDDPRSDGPIAVDVATDRSALYPHADGLAASLPVLQDAEHVAISPDGARVAYRSRESGAYEIWAADTLPPVSMPTRLTSVSPEMSGSEAGRPAWSPDGGTIAFVVDGSSIWLMNADGTGKRALTAGDNPAWSPDGQRIAFNRGAGSLACGSTGCGSSLHVIDASGLNERTLVGYPGSPADPIEHQVFPGWDPDWSPDGRYLAYTGQHFISFDGGYSVPRVMLLDLDAPIQPGPPLGPEPANPRPLVDPSGAGAAPCQAPAWSPGGDRLVYSCRNTSRPDDLTPLDTLWIAGLDGGSPQPTGLGGVSSDWGTWPPALHPVVMLGTPFTAAVSEGDADGTLSVPVPLSFFNEAAPAPIDVHWQAVAEDATENVDYSPASGILTFRPGETSLPLSLTILGDDIAEANETFLVCWSVNPDENTCRWSTRVTIRDDDSGNRPPAAANDVAATAPAAPVAVDVLANDSDPDADSLSLTAVGTPAHGTATIAAGTVVYTPNAGFEGVEHFLYTVSDGTNISRGAVSVYVGQDASVPPPPVLTVTPPFLDFGAVPVNKTRDLTVTIRNGTGAPVAMSETWSIAQVDPYPFDAGDLEGCAFVPILNPGDSCTRRVRFWSVPGAEASSPASVAILDRNSFQPLATIPLFASVGTPDTGPNTPPAAVDDLAAVAPGFTQNLDALRNDTDPEDDLLRITGVSDPPNGAARVIPCAPLHRMTPSSDCIEYVPDAGYLGIDAIAYTASDGRGGTATATYHLAVGTVVPSVSSITPDFGPVDGGQAVRIIGSNFLYRSSAAFVCGGVTLPLNVTSRTDTEILATTPPGIAGLCSVRVTTLFAQTGQRADAYRYETGLPADTTPPIAVLDVPLHVAPGQALTLSGVRSTDAGGTITRYRWAIPDAGIEIETTTPTYDVPAADLGTLPAGSHGVTLIVFDASGNQSTPAAQAVDVIARQVVSPADAGLVTAPIQIISAGPGDQNDPHVHKDLMAFTDNSNITSRIQFFDFLAGAGAAVPQTAGDRDLLPDVNGNRILFSRVMPDRIGIVLFNAATGSSIEIDPRAGVNRFGTALGGNTLLYVDLLSGNGDIVAYDLATSTTSVVSGSPDVDQNPAVSPDGTVVVWMRETAGTSPDIFKAVRVQGMWNVSPVVATSAPEETPDTDGTWIVYGRWGAGARAVFFRSVAGGPEFAIGGFVEQGLPAISEGVISFRGRRMATDPMDLFVYDIASNRLYQLTSSSDVEGLSDISVLDNGDVRVVWAAAPDDVSLHRVYAATFSLLPRPTLTVASASGEAGQTVLLSATLTSAGAPVDDARLEFQIEGDPGLALARTDPNGVATVSVPLRVNPGTYPTGIRAGFAGDPLRRLGPATGFATLTVDRASTALALTTTPDPVVVTEPLTAIAVVSSAFAIPAGDVSFTVRDGASVTPLGAVPLDANGAATLIVPGLPVGGHVICAEYPGSTIHADSVNCSRVTVTRATTQTTLTSSRNPSLSTGPPVFIATIQTTAAVQPAGKVEFFANGTLLCRSTVFALGGVRTQASCGGAPLPVGAHSITASYTGDANFGPSSSAALSQTVQPGGYFALDLGFEGEAVALSPGGWVTGHSELKSALAASTTVTAYVHDGTTLGMPQPIPSLGGPRTVAVGVDDTGRVGGSSATAAGATHVFLFDGITTRDHHNPAFGGENSRAMAMNSSGAIVGIADTATAFRAFVDLRAGAFDLGTIAGGTHSAAFAISEPVFGTSGLGHIAGVATVPGGAGHAALFGGAAVIDLGTLGGPASGASAVNRAGESAGFSDVPGGGRRAFIHRDGSMLDIGGPLGSSLSLATAMNDAGQVVGTHEDTSSGTPVSRTFLYSLDTTTDLGPGTFVTLNNGGVVVSNTSSAIAVRTGGSVLLLGSGSGGLGSHQGPAMNASAINDEGRIAGFTIGANGRPRATVWIPVGLASLAADAATAPAGATVSLSATLTSQGLPVANKTIRFAIDGVDAGSAVTDASGRATVTAALPALAEGTYPEGIRALFTGDETLGGAVATAALTVAAASADLGIAASASAATVDAGGTVRYTVTVTNSGPSPASDVSINVSGPASLTFGATNSPGGPCVRSIFDGSLDCDVIAPIPAGGQYVLTIDATPSVAGTVSAAFVVTGSSGDPAPANNQAVVAVNVNPATDLAIAVVPSRTLIAVGESLTYAVSVTNNGPVTAPLAGATITADNGFTIDQITLPALSCTTMVFSRTWTCALGDIQPGATVQFSVIGRVTASSPGTNSFAVGSALPDPNRANNTAAAAFDARPTVTINQAPGQSDPATTAPLTFTVVFSEPVTGFGNADISFAGSSIGGTLAATVTGSGANYNVAVSGMTGVGTVAVSIPAGAAVDSGGNPSAASTSTDSTVLFGVATVVAIVSPQNGGNAALTVLRFGNSLNGILFYARSGVLLTATRFTSLVIDGQTATVEGFSTNNRFFVVVARDGGSGGSDAFRLWIEGVEQTAGGALTSGSVLVQPWTPDTRLRGWVDLHTHPMSNLAFGGKLFHGAPSAGSLMPAMQMPSDALCRIDERAASIDGALSQDGPTRGDRLQSQCGNFVRNTLIRTIESINGAAVAPAGADGYPAFTYWPKWYDITHQKMWVDWIRRSWEGGQRVMVALSHNNRTLAEMLGAGGPISGVTADRASSDLQIEEIKRLVADHPDFMAVATTPGELHTIVQGGRLAVVLGMEIDKIGDFSTTAPPSLADIDAEIARLHALGVRYILPLHFVDNPFGDAAIHQDLYNILNFRENQGFFTVGCAQLSDGIGFRATGLPPMLAPFLLPGMPAPIVPGCQPGGTFLGHVNARSANGLTTGGEFAIRAMMRRGMIVDIDHMSNRAANRTLAIATAVPGGGYPLTSGHAGMRERSSPQFNAETSRSTAQLARIACLGGMFGLGTDAAGGHRWAAQYERGYNVMRRAFAPNGLCPGTIPLGGGFIALGTDANSLVKTPVPPMLDPVGPVRFADIYNPGNPLNAGVPPLTRSTTGTRTWDYNIDGVAHYGMFVDFLRDVRMWNPAGVMPGRQIVDDQMMYGADHFYRMWLKADGQKTRVP